MIILSEIARKLENMLNGIDEETNSIVRPSNFYFKVETMGFHIDHIKEKQTGQNFIPVFISSLGGEYDPVKDIKRQSRTYQIAFYFPVRFKEQFFAMEDFLFDCFVGQYRNYGELSGKCLSNISPAEYGDIRDLDLAQYKKWVSDVYKEEIVVMEKWMTMEIKLYLSTAKSDLMFANAIDYELEFQRVVRRAYCHITYNDEESEEYTLYPVENKKVGETKYFAIKGLTSGRVLYVANSDSLLTNTIYEYINGEMKEPTNYTMSAREGFKNYTLTLREKLNWTQGGSALNVSPISQQLIDDDDYTKNVSNIVNYQKSIIAYFKMTELWYELNDAYNSHDMSSISGLKLVKTYNYPSGASKSYDYDQLVLQLDENGVLGNLLSFTISFGDR